MRFCDLPIMLEGSVVEQRARQVFAELAERNLRVRPAIWLSEEWFNPDGVNGFAIPFYLVHQRLIRLEKKMMLEAEGATEAECVRILRHETGHAVDEAFQLHTLREYRQVFGSPSRRYPASYAVRPHSRDYVLHLNAWYAQAHPVEDFAETFAVWLQPKHLWRRKYRNWPALQKLEVVDRWMAHWANKLPLVDVQQPAEELATDRRTLGEHYSDKRSFYRLGGTSEIDSALRRIFPENTDRTLPRTSAVSVLRSVRAPLRKEVARPLGVAAYAVDQVLRQLIQRAKVLNLRHSRPTPDTVNELTELVAQKTQDLITHSPRLPL